MRSRPKLIPLATICALGATLALAACGGSASNSTAREEDERKILRFAKCMREHGVNVSKPNSTGGPLRVTTKNPQAMEAAQRACQRYRPTGGREKLSPQERVAREEAVQKFAKCMREHGIDVQTATSGGGVGIKIQGRRGQGGSGPNPESPAFQAAQKTCQRLLPKPPGGGAGFQTSKAGGHGESGPGLSLSPAGGG
jgi:pyruvate/2-oxoglutarate dehydrogenase complex dihydrolipoamide acyltransferase (E2) component